MSYDAILLASFGGPEGQDDVIPFLKNVTRGKGIPEERLEEVAVHYRHHGGVSPINQQNRDLKAALEAELARRDIDLPVYWGNRNWDPYFTDALRKLHADGKRDVLAIVTSAYTSYSGVGQYREDFERALDETGLRDEVRISRIREFFDHPGFIAPFVEGVRSALDELTDAAKTHIMFVTHSIPTTAATESGPEYGEGGAYEAQHLAVADAVLAGVGTDAPHSLVYQSRSGNPATPWLEPDINDAIAALDGVDGLVIVPIGFVSDHMEVIWDLDTEAMETAGENNIRAVRVPTPGVHEAFVAGLVDLLLERINAVPDSERPHESPLGPWPDHPSQGAALESAVTTTR
ncbi:ferrochelatase [Microbacterium sp. MPKO10]|uniref:ferrochelatase n=1 Tax=Microbacterium sp. MPKO10 TaxID=2989818 RepID=UPI002235660E|nr:ferrochelatase [Microbacterium sp. MPKO10]MCW4457090.1 ferrochelatase [Microbacterium sp. MPKO10]